jgi:hypothetical protein
MRKLLFNYSLYSHPEIRNFRVSHLDSELDVNTRLLFAFNKSTEIFFLKKVTNNTHNVSLDSLYLKTTSSGFVVASLR